MSDNIKEKIIAELDRRINNIREHQYDQIEVSGDQFSELNQALKKVIGMPLKKELESIREFINKI
ncbi:MAG: hypothetical protein R2876_00950 [Eubacteriales bacterium]